MSRLVRARMAERYAGAPVRLHNDAVALVAAEHWQLSFSVRSLNVLPRVQAPIHRRAASAQSSGVRLKAIAASGAC